MDSLPERPHRHLVKQDLPDPVAALLLAQEELKGAISDEEVARLGEERGIGSELRTEYQDDWEHPFRGHS